VGKHCYELPLRQVSKAQLSPGILGSQQTHLVRKHHTLIKGETRFNCIRKRTSSKGTGPEPLIPPGVGGIPSIYPAFCHYCIQTGIPTAACGSHLKWAEGSFFRLPSFSILLLEFT